ncbi:MAG: 16S rRNA (uracil1498-N3)-methyltransferase [Parasphingorhabdus sp.]|jgi:16S rRNA (uracil1498-N3)-methyltransferase
MTAQTDRFYFDSIEPLVSGRKVIVNNREAEHMSRVKRHRIGNQVLLINGKGYVAQCQITNIHKKNGVELDVKSVEFIQPSPLQLHIATAIPKGDRMETMLDMLTQLGVTTITPLIYARSQPDGRRERQQRWQHVIIDACKQSRRAYLPEVKSLCSVDQFLNKVSSVGGGRWLADAGGCNPLIGSAVGSLTQTIVIGPEGGLDEEEKARFNASGFEPLQLAESILRIETATIAAAILLGSLVKNKIS